MRRMPEDGQRLVSSSYLPHVRTRRLLRSIAKPSCHQALPRDPASHHRGLRSPGRMGVVLRRSADAGPGEQYDAAGWSHTALLLAWADAVDASGRKPFSAVRDE